MKLRALALALLMVTGTTAVARADVKPYIVGGEFVASAPWAVQLENGGSFGCTGSIIAPEWVLTAKHCSGDSVRVGDINLGRGERRAVAEAVANPQADMQLLRLESGVDTEYVRLADEAPAVGRTNHIYGWGTTDYECCDSISPILKRGAVKVIGLARDYYGGVAVETRWETGTAGYGDSGGPQLDGGVQVGVCSTGDYVKTQYASVAHYRGWIRATAGV
ncbi:S1 family peptidase [Lentzea sp. NPDC051213]|uniref:S1 family peptidase n=1 Tax=Lentzea sp. NPDC051213 TaxID=3364126 RepID=UPI0037987C97